MKAKDARQILECSYTTLHNYVKQGIIKATRNCINNYLIFDDKSVLELAKRNQTLQNYIIIHSHNSDLNFSNIDDERIEKVINFLKDKNNHEIA